MSKSEDNKLCPSYAPKPGAELYGIVNSSGFINYLNSTLEVNEAFIEDASKGRDLDKRFRFAGNCAKTGCKQWDGANSLCGLIDTLINILNNPEPKELQYCPIRERCRWYSQKKGLACGQCNEVIRNIEMKMIELD